MAKHYEMWEKLGLDLEKHDQFLNPVPELFTEIFIKQDNRPEGMDYYDFVVGDIHGVRVKELVAEKDKGNPVISSFCAFVPDELIIAAGGASIGLCAGAQFPIPRAELELPNDICPLIKSSVGFKLERVCPYFEVSDFVVGETTCDGKKKAWEFLNEHISTYVMELPNTKSASGHQLWQSEIERFKLEIEERSGRKITTEKLAEAIKLVNKKRSVLERLYNTRKANPAPISGRDTLLITQLAFFDDPARFIEKTEKLCEELEARIANKQGVVNSEAPRILIAGTPMPLPSWKLHSIIESNGGVVVCEETCTGTRYFESKVAENGQNLAEQLVNLSERAMNINCACFTPNEARVDDILRLANEYNVDGVIYYNLQFCQTYNMEYNKVADALKKADIPVTQIESDFSENDSGQLNTRIQAFLEML
ncbi:double-cubane-cluster-containing anaerobic reductase [Halanaerobium salsuginis]|jgi:benzoyl-CoA reductase/2-hydroxyglutaryl-CoA dehydratase subunit BcrC/BadD/HgdB|uniref:Benzoyl-CoA reductase/2-hydroxyglutaryl-CoA dehydratase subunit, BcrC/BadD/HgdB n=1 Tax=Halanaerobium salsuginis TaxID=29563 RepID=A0A1I4FNF0_9FIRM|nr:double-cubane-cluster-containing anaerobic reductase [Halanaerobium salsuginis]SFL19438.1 Benzoyl-CoA reductase/2-hydroxyglutaryl-CoA dehydratase subunit, BcrC/BadD/HgdB [Halanaerobium salsuginis]